MLVVVFRLPLVVFDFLVSLKQVVQATILVVDFDGMPYRCCLACVLSGFVSRVHWHIRTLE